MSTRYVDSTENSLQILLQKSIRKWNEQKLSLLIQLPWWNEKKRSHGSFGESTKSLCLIALLL